MARDTYIIRPKTPVRPVPPPVTHEMKIRQLAHHALRDVARRIEARTLKQRLP